MKAKKLRTQKHEKKRFKRQDEQVEVGDLVECVLKESVNGQGWSECQTTHFRPVTCFGSTAGVTRCLSSGQRKRKKEKTFSVKEEIGLNAEQELKESRSKNLQMRNKFLCNCKHHSRNVAL